MPYIVKSLRHRNAQVWVNNALVFFNAEGICEGIVAISENGVSTKLEAPIPLRPQDVEVFRLIHTYEVLKVGDDGEQTPVEPSEVLEAIPEPEVVDAYSTDGVSSAPEFAAAMEQVEEPPATEAAPEPEEPPMPPMRTVNTEGPREPDPTAAQQLVDQYTRAELMVMASERGIAFSNKSTKHDLAEALAVGD